jgi:proline iminopeptidase
MLKSPSEYGGNLMVLILILFVLLGAFVEAADFQVEEGFLTMPDGVRLYYNKRGSGPNKIVVPAALFVEQDLKSLASPDRTLIFYDMRNRGMSDYVQNAETLTIQQDVEDLEQLRKHFQFDRISLIGISYLGEMIILYAMKYPDHVDRLVQIGSVPFNFTIRYLDEYESEDPRKVIDPAMDKELKDLSEKGYDAKYPREYCMKEWQTRIPMFIGDPAKASRIEKSPCHLPNEWPVHLRRHLQQHFASVQKLDVSRDAIRKLEHPVLTIHGTRDRNAPYGGGREWVYLLPNARLLTLPGVAHFATAEAPEVVLPAIDRFLKGEWPQQVEKVTEDPVKK